ncbi:methyltransferase-like protein 5 [Galendromus occidentalis]|uniref:Methyltransferase-like protein 5 n=1 Tax=Galendromus occidentalis TaxID=34638 RepID=A0AAJ6VYV2_9ACAR|nr:methyltransferase-like protein 5 [Galendromus occidentalis]
MKLKKLKSILDGVETFDSPNVDLEQYPTPPDIAAEMLHHVFSSGDIEGKLILDLGCGGGILSIGASILGASQVVAIDIDSGPLEIFQSNLEEFEVTNISMLQASVSHLSSMMRMKADTVIMNPPFGTRNKGADLMFLEIASSLCSKHIYSLHKTSTREHLIRKAEKRGLKCEVIAQLRYNIDKIYGFHKRDSRDIEVDFIKCWNARPT